MKAFASERERDVEEGEKSDGALTRDRKFKSDEKSRNKEVYVESRSFPLTSPAAAAWDFRSNWSDLKQRTSSCRLTFFLNAKTFRRHK